MLIMTGSLFESILLQYPRNQYRTFTTPLQYVTFNNDVFPDFCLIDASVSELSSVEVFGMNTPPYCVHNALKENDHDDLYGTTLIIMVFNRPLQVLPFPSVKGFGFLPPHP